MTVEVPPDPARRFRASRLIAPLALLAVGFALFTVVSSSIEDEPTTEDATSRTNSTGGGGEKGGRKGKQGGAEKTPKRYVVQSGDTITAIAERFGVSVDQIRSLNPEADAQALTPGDKLKLRS